MLTDPQPTLRPYAFVTDGSAGSFMDNVARAISRDASAQDLLCRPQAEVMSDLKARAKSSGKPAIKSLYWSVRCPDATAWGGLRARTLLADPTCLRWIDLADDPSLPALASLIHRPGHWRTLRYVPLRRATFLHQPVAGPARIVKLKRPDRAAEAAARLAATLAALGPDPGFDIPRLLALGADGSFALSLCHGTPIGIGLPHDAPGLLRRIGRMHARLHCADPSLLPKGLPVAALDCLTLSAALLPDLASRLGPLMARLGHRPGVAPPVLCHGDFGLEQILHDDGALSLVDLDLCHAGDAAADIARFLVALADDQPDGVDPAVAEANYLDGYAEVRTLPDPARMRWFRAGAVAARLLVCLRKDQTHGGRIGRLLAQIDAQVLA